MILTRLGIYFHAYSTLPTPMAYPRQGVCAILAQPTEPGTPTAVAVVPHATCEY